MTTTTRRGLRATAAVAVAGSLIGLQALTSAAVADSTIIWTPSSAPAGTGFWSNSCPTSGTSGTGIPNDSSNLHQTLVDDQKSVAPSRTMAPESGADVGWGYLPTTGTEAGPSITLANPSTTTSLAVTVQGTSTGHAMVYYQAAGAPDYYVGIAPLTSTSRTATTFTWYHWSANLVGPNSWHAMFVPFLQPPTAKTIADFANTAGNNNTPLPTGTWYASLEYGCTGTFAIDHLQVTDATGVTDYNLQNDLSKTKVNAAALQVTYPGHTTISSTTTTTAGGAVTSGTVTLQTESGGAWSNASAPQAPGSSFDVAPSATTTYRVHYDSDPSTPSVAAGDSDPVTVSVAPTLALKASRSTMNVGNSATFTATFAPVRSGITVTFQQKSGTSSWQGIGTAVTNSSGAATLTKSRSASGLWTVRAYASAQAGRLASNTPSVSIKVYQPVSISAYRSTSTVYVGHSFRIYGTLTPHWSGIPLQLKQYVGGRWIIVASGHSGTRGAYSFTKTARSAGTAAFRVVAPSSGYRLTGRSAVVRVSIIWPPVYTPPPPPPPSGGGGGGGSGIG